MGIVIEVGANSDKAASEVVHFFLRHPRHSTIASIQVLELNDRLRILEEDQPRNDGNGFLTRLASNSNLSANFYLENGDFISVYPPGHADSRTIFWRIVFESKNTALNMPSDLIFSKRGVAYVAISQDETLGLEAIPHLTNDNFPWNHWLLIDAKVK
jgi:hypothetical protein